jgi:transcriptional regulator with XRE-family HTH domain
VRVTQRGQHGRFQNACSSEPSADGRTQVRQWAIAPHGGRCSRWFADVSDSASVLAQHSRHGQSRSDFEIHLQHQQLQGTGNYAGFGAIRMRSRQAGQRTPTGLGVNLRRLLAETGISQAELARRTGIARPVLNFAINDKRTATAFDLARIAAGLHVPVERLLVGVEVSDEFADVVRRASEVIVRLLGAEADRDLAQAEVAHLRLESETDGEPAALRWKGPRDEQLARLENRLANCERRNRASAAREASLRKTIASLQAELVEAYSSRSTVDILTLIARAMIKMD